MSAAVVVVGAHVTLAVLITCLVVNGVDVNFKCSDVGHEEGQNPSVEHLRAGDTGSVFV